MVETVWIRHWNGPTSSRPKIQWSPTDIDVYVFGAPLDFYIYAFHHVLMLENDKDNHHRKAYPAKKEYHIREPNIDIFGLIVIQAFPPHSAEDSSSWSFASSRWRSASSSGTCIPCSILTRPSPSIRVEAENCLETSSRTIGLTLIPRCHSVDELCQIQRFQVHRANPPLHRPFPALHRPFPPLKNHENLQKFMILNFMS